MPSRYRRRKPTPLTYVIAFISFLWLLVIFAIKVALFAIKVVMGLVVFVLRGLGLCPKGRVKGKPKSKS
jgi:hypothetical protein